MAELSPLKLELSIDFDANALTVSLATALRDLADRIDPKSTIAGEKAAETQIAYYAAAAEAVVMAPQRPRLGTVYKDHDELNAAKLPIGSQIRDKDGDVHELRKHFDGACDWDWVRASDGLPAPEGNFIANCYAPYTLTRYGHDEAVR